jgi:hypothetical protein
MSLIASGRVENLLGIQDVFSTEYGRSTLDARPMGNKPDLQNAVLHGVFQRR